MIIGRSRLLLGALPLLAAGCQPSPGPGQNAAQLQALPQAKVCEASLPPFGRWYYAGSGRGIGGEYIPPDGSIRMDNDGGWCVIAFTHYWGHLQQPIQAPLAVSRPPAHGQVIAGSIGTSLRIAYRPDPGFTGTDAFHVRMDAVERWDIPVQVIVDAGVANRG